MEASGHYSGNHAVIGQGALGRELSFLTTSLSGSVLRSNSFVFGASAQAVLDCATSTEPVLKKHQNVDGWPHSLNSFFVVNTFLNSQTGQSSAWTGLQITGWVLQFRKHTPQLSGLIIEIWSQDWIQDLIQTPIWCKWASHVGGFSWRFLLIFWTNAFFSQFYCNDISFALKHKLTTRPAIKGKAVICIKTIIFTPLSFCVSCQRNVCWHRSTTSFLKYQTLKEAAKEKKQKQKYRDIAYLHTKTGQLLMRFFPEDASG